MNTVEINTNREKLKYGLLAAAVTACGLCLMLWHSGTYPFGSDSLLFVDLGTQYTDFIQFFTDSSPAEKLYSFRKGFGGPTTGFLSYYALSPFNFIACLFPDSEMELAVFFIILAKFIFMSLAAYLYFSHHYENCLLNSAFAVAYSFYPFFVRLYYHILWLDCFRLLPLLVLGCEKATDKKGKGLFICMFAAALLTNYYIAYMCGIFILLYFVYYVVINDKNLQEIIAGIREMAVATLTAAMLAAPVLLPSAVQLMEGKLSGHYSSAEWPGVMFSIPAALATFFDGTIFYNIPQLAGSSVFVLLAVIYMFSKDIPAKEKIASAIFYAVMLLSLYNGILYHIWHGFSPPMDFAYRNTFAYAFLLLLICRKGADRLNFSQASLGCVAAAVFFALAGFMIKENRVGLSRHSLAFTAVVTASALVAVLVLYRSRKAACTVLSAVIITAAVFNGCVYMKSEKQIYSGIYPPLPAGEYRQNHQAVSAALENTMDTSFYRIADITARNYNQPMGTGYYGTNHYSSTFDINQKRMFVHFGYQDTFYSTIYNHSDVLTDSLFGIKYLLSSQQDSYSSHYPLLWQGERNLYSNPYRLPILFTADTDSVEYSDDGRIHTANMFLALTDVQVLNYDGSTDYAALSAAAGKLQETSAQIIKQDGAFLEFTAQGSYLLSTVLYDENWHIKVNGTPVQPRRFMEHFISFPLQGGLCHIEMIYIPRGFVPGCRLMAVALCGIFINYIKKKKGD